MLAQLVMGISQQQAKGVTIRRNGMWASVPLAHEALSKESLE
jgi:hypothetical protein